MSDSRTPRPSSAPSWKRVSLHFAHLSTNFSLDATPDLSVPMPELSLPVPKESPLFLHISFRVRATAAFGCSIAVIGSTPELGEWNLDLKVMLTTRPGEYPTWTSAEVAVRLGSKSQSLEYKYVYVDRVTARQSSSFWERKIPNRKLDVKLSFADEISWTVSDVFEEVSQHSLDARGAVPLLASLSEDGSLYDYLQQLCAHLEKRGPDATLQDYLTVAHLFRHWTSRGEETESKQSLDQLLRLHEVLQTHSTAEIEPVLRDIVSHMAKCSTPFRKITHCVLDRSLVETNGVPLGCHSEELSDFLTDFLNLSPDSDTLVRLITLNSVRRCMRKLRQRSSTPDLLVLYDIYLEEIESSYIHEFSPESARLLTVLHHVATILESLGLSSICASECLSYSSALSEASHSREYVVRHWESIKAALLDIARIFTRWVATYSHVQVVEDGQDVLGLERLLADIAKRAVKGLFPSLACAIQLLDEDMRMAYYCPINPGSATGKIVKMASLSEMPASFPSVIAIATAASEPTPSLPDCLKALILLRDIDLSSALVAECHAKGIALAFAAPSRIPENVESRAQVHIFEDSLEFP